MPFPFLILHVFSWGPRQLCTFVSAEFSFVIYPYLRSFAKYTVPSVTYIRRSGVLILNHFWFSDLHPFKGFCQVYGFVNNVHPSMWNLVTQPFFFFFPDLHPFKGFCQVYGFVSNVHPSRWNLVTQSTTFFFVFLTYTHLRDFAKCMASSVTYIRQGEILLLNYFLCILLES